jgi:hypothetical protein
MTTVWSAVGYIYCYYYLWEIDCWIKFAWLLLFYNFFDKENELSPV